MRCVVCRGDTTVIDSRLSADGTARIRRRGCLVCGRRFRTVETVA